MLFRLDRLMAPEEGSFGCGLSSSSYSSDSIDIHVTLFYLITKKLKIIRKKKEFN